MHTPPPPTFPPQMQEREEKCLAGLKDKYRQHHAAILHGQTAFDAVLAEEEDEEDATEEHREGEEEGDGVGTSLEQGRAQQELEQDQREEEGDQGERVEEEESRIDHVDPRSISGIGSGLEGEPRVSLWPSVASTPTST